MAYKRIETIVSLVPKDAHVLDIGTDHGFVPIFLFKRGITTKITALDINPKPLALAKDNFIKAKLLNQIDLLLNDGLKDIDPNIYDVIIIAGMGGKTIGNIIDQKKFNGKLILHPTNNEFDLREILVKNNFKIINELIVKENKIFNLIIEAQFSITKQKLNQKEMIIGPKLFLNNKIEVTEYYLKKQHFYQNLYIKSNKIEYKKIAKKYQKIVTWRKRKL